MKWEKTSEVLKELGKWFLNAALLFLSSWVIQPFIKGDNSLFWIGLVTIFIFVLLGAILIWISEAIDIKEERKGGF